MLGFLFILPMALKAKAQLQKVTVELENVSVVELIKELKRIGLPLKSIGSLLQDKNLDQIKTTLESNMLVQRQQLYEHIKRYDSLVDTLLKLNNALSLISQWGCRLILIFDPRDV